MHEMSIVQNLVAIVEEEMVKNNASRLISVRVKIGELSGIVPEALSTCFEIYTSKSDLKGAVLKMEIEPLIGSCRKCNEKFKIIEYDFSCPECDSADIDMISGREMSIVEIEVD